MINEDDWSIFCLILINSTCYNMETQIIYFFVEHVLGLFVMEDSWQIVNMECLLMHLFIHSNEHKIIHILVEWASTSSVI